MYLDLTGVMHTPDKELDYCKVKQKVAALTALDVDGYNLVVVVCKSGRHWSPAVAELVTECIEKRMYPEDSTQVQCLHLHQWDQWIPIGESKMSSLDYRHCSILNDDFSYSSIGQHTDCSHWQPHSARYNGNFTSEHAEVFRRFQESMDAVSYTHLRAHET